MYGAYPRSAATKFPGLNYSKESRKKEVCFPEMPGFARNFFMCIPGHLLSPGTFLCTFIYFFCVPRHRRPGRKLFYVRSWHLLLFPAFLCTILIFASLRPAPARDVSKHCFPIGFHWVPGNHSHLIFHPFIATQRPPAGSGQELSFLRSLAPPEPTNFFMSVPLLFLRSWIFRPGRKLFYERSSRLRFIFPRFLL